MAGHSPTYDELPTDFRAIASYTLLDFADGPTDVIFLDHPSDPAMYFILLRHPRAAKPRD